MLERFKLETVSHSRNKNFQFWQLGCHAEEIYSEKFMWSKIDYIYLNPVRFQIVAKAEDYIYSSTSNCINGARNNKSRTSRNTKGRCFKTNFF